MSKLQGGAPSGRDRVQDAKSGGITSRQRQLPMHLLPGFLPSLVLLSPVIDRVLTLTCHVLGQVFIALKLLRRFRLLAYLGKRGRCVKEAAKAASGFICCYGKPIFGLAVDILVDPSSNHGLP